MRGPLRGSRPRWRKEYLSGHEDLPQLAGLRQDLDSVTVLDVPQGRIVETFAQTPQSADAVFLAYAETLPQMGWTRETRARYVRGAETLVFEVRQGFADGGADSLDFRLKIFGRTWRNLDESG